MQTTYLVEAFRNECRKLYENTNNLFITSDDMNAQITYLAKSLLSNERKRRNTLL